MFTITLVIIVCYNKTPMRKTWALWRIPPKPTPEERLLLTSLFCVSIINYLVFLAWSEVSHNFEIIGVVV